MGEQSLETKNTEIDGIKITESKSTQLFGTDALMLSAYVRRNPSACAAELGAGSGAISVILAERGAFKSIKAVEIQEELYRLCKSNIEENGLADVVTPICADVRTLSPAALSGVSVIFANPPYMITGGGKESPESSKQTARHEVFGGVREVVSFAGRVLKTGGGLYVVYRPDRLQTLMKALTRAAFPLSE
jgi:tRNA1(Val) A37 N6-methylase TrmN6